MHKRSFIFTLPAILGLCAPLVVFAAPPAGFDCCRCSLSYKDAKKDDICLLTPTGKPCDTAQQTAVKKSGQDFSWTCGQLDPNACDKVGTSATSICVNKPTIPENLTYSAALLMLGKAATTTSAAPDVEANQAGMYAATPPALGIPIPGVSFPSKLETGDGKVFVPYLAIYISGFQKYLIALSLIAAAVMIIYGGFKYIIASTGAGVQSGKEVIKDALIGAALVMGAYVILANLNPQTANPTSLAIPIVKAQPYDFMGMNPTAPQQLLNAGVARKDLSSNPVPGTEIAPPNPDPSLKFPTYLTIPKDCPGRASGKNSIGALSPEMIKKYLEYQSKTGIPAGALIANMLTEGAGKCVIQNLWPDPAAACGCKGAKNYCGFYNYGGVGCTKGQMPPGLNGANCAFPPAYKDNPWTKKVIGKNICDSDSPADFAPNKYWNNIGAVGSDCLNICRQKGAPENYDCGFGDGGKCYPQISYTTVNLPEGVVAYRTVQCSKVFSNIDEFLNYEKGFIKYCMPYNTSVYDFAYCIGASTYASEVLKGPILADIIEKNCLCGSRDASNCLRNKTVEDKLVKEKIKINFSAIMPPCLEWYDAKQKNCKKYAPESDWDTIAQKIYDKTKGTLVIRELE